MIRQLAWNTFKKTGNIDTYLELTQVKNIEDNIKEQIDGNNKGKGNNNF